MITTSEKINGNYTHNACFFKESKSSLFELSVTSYMKLMTIIFIFSFIFSHYTFQDKYVD